MKTVSNDELKTVALEADQAILERIDAFEAADAEAVATECEFRAYGCDGDGHEGGVDPALWGHRIERLTFDDVLDVQIVREPGAQEFTASIYTKWDAEFTASEVRGHAEKWEKYSAFLVSVADKLEGLNSKVGA